jgi:zinc transporter 9
LLLSRGLSAAASHELGDRAESRRLIKIALVGNFAIAAAKASIWAMTGSSALMSETIHSLVGCANQTLLLVGHRASESKPDKIHQYGYGKDIYFWSLISALGTFWFGAGVSGWNSVLSILDPSVSVELMGLEMWSVLGFSFAVDGYVLSQTVRSLWKSKPSDVSFLGHVRRIRDPTTAAVLMEDSAACLGIMVAVGGIGLTQLTQMPIFDSVGGLGVSAIMGCMGIYLASINHQYLLGQAVDAHITEDIKRIMLARPSVDDVHNVQSQWMGPYAFAYKAEVDFDGTFLAAKLMRRYQNEFMGGRKLDVDEVKLLLAWYAEDVMRTVEQEVKDIETQIKRRYPLAAFIELEPHSRKVRSYAIDDGMEASSKRLEIDRINLIQEGLLLARSEDDLDNNTPIAELAKGDSLTGR